MRRTALSLFFPSLWSLSSAYTIQVCTNKDCCKRFQGKAADLPQTLEQLLPSSIDTETTGCLSHCGEGPNICVRKEDGSEEIHHGVSNANTAVAVLELSDPSLQIHPTLLAAVNVMEKAQKVDTVDEQERFLSSVINALSKNPDLHSSKAMAYACTLRAQVFLDKKQLDLARQDIAVATKILPLQAKAYRVLADIEEADRNTLGAIEALSRLAKADPSFRSKVKGEISRLQQDTVP